MRTYQVVILDPRVRSLPAPPLTANSAQLGSPAAPPARRRPVSGPVCEPPPRRPDRQVEHHRVNRGRGRSRQPRHNCAGQGDSALSDPGKPRAASIAEPPRAPSAERQRQTARRTRDQRPHRHGQSRQPVFAGPPPVPGGNAPAPAPPFRPAAITAPATRTCHTGPMPAHNRTQASHPSHSLPCKRLAYCPPALVSRV